MPIEYMNSILTVALWMTVLLSKISQSCLERFLSIVHRPNILSLFLNYSSSSWRPIISFIYMIPSLLYTSQFPTYALGHFSSLWRYISNELFELLYPEFNIWSARRLRFLGFVHASLYWLDCVSKRLARLVLSFIIVFIFLFWVFVRLMSPNYFFTS